MRRISLSVGILLAALVAGGLCGYHLKTVEFEPISSVPKLDYFVEDESFSEIQNAKATLAGLSARFLTELQVRRCVQMNAQRLKSGPLEGHDFSYDKKMIAQLERGIEEFRGTEEELTLTGDLLRVLRANGQDDDWLRIYLCLLYTHPTNSLVGSYASDAVELGQRLGRKQEVIDGLEHVVSIPLDFQNKIQLQTALVQIPATLVCCSLESGIDAMDWPTNAQTRLMKIHPVGPVIATSATTLSNKWFNF